MGARRNVFAIAPGAPFLATFVEAFLAGDIIPGLSRKSDPLLLARARIYVPTQRAGRALAAQFAQGYGGGATLLPRILPLGGLEERETAAIFGDFAADFDATARPQIEEIERRLLLAQLVINWSKAVDAAIVRVEPDGGFVHDETEPFLVAATPAGAYTLAAELSALIDEFNIEGVTAAAVDRLVDEGDFEDYWRITTRFLAIALEEWPKLLEALGRIDPSTRQKLLIEAQIARLAKETGPVVAIGSTGAQPTTARLLCAIAAREQGAVVLPGLDTEMDEAAWAWVGEGDQEPAFTHPQTMLKRLIGAMKLQRDDVPELGAMPLALEKRRALVSQAMLPADATANWRLFRDAEATNFGEALDGVTLLEAPDEQIEALALALFLRESLETPAQTAALVTPDRNLARRVAAELRRFEIDIDDSGGASLASTPSGALARLIAQTATGGLSAVAVAALLHHPLARFGRDRDDVAALAPLIEAGVLRAVPWSPSLANLATRARAAAQDVHAHPAAKRITDADWAAIEALLADVEGAFAPFAALSGAGALGTFVETHRRCFEAIVEADRPADDEGALALFDLFERLSLAAAPDNFDASAYAALFDHIAFETTLRGPMRAHPRLKILGPLEARLMEVDLLLIAGLDETVWPPQTETGAFLNRSMRRLLGLTPPERRIGQSAHDFVMAMGAPKVVLSRAKKRDGSPTVASRFLTRLEAVAGDAMKDCRERGARMLAIAAALDQPSPDEIRTPQRPAPRPKLELRPQRLSVTRIETLRRDPYAIFAEYILRLKPLAPLGADIGARELGTAIHAALETFVRRHPTGALPDDARDILQEIARENLREFLADPAFQTFTWPRLQEGLDHALAFEAERRDKGGVIHMEASGAWRITLADGSLFTLSAKADRIEIVGAEAFVFDYKTGAPPSIKQVQAGWNPQLTLEAAMIEAGAFEGLGSPRAAGAGYVGLKDGGETKLLKFRDATFSDIVAKHSGELVDMLTQFRDANTPYPSRPHVAMTKFEGDYDHLARVKEWSRGGDEG
jgi:ATP-dependent helicase/nuclease subunit B